MRKAKVFFHPIDGSASLEISWSDRPKGDAIEAKKGEGVGFFSENGNLLSVIFDEVLEDRDHQILEFSEHRIEVRVKEGRVAYTLSRVEKPKSPRKCIRRKLSKKP